MIVHQFLPNARSSPRLALRCALQYGRPLSNSHQIRISAARSSGPTTPRQDVQEGIIIQQVEKLCGYHKAPATNSDDRVEVRIVEGRNPLLNNLGMRTKYSVPVAWASSASSPLAIFIVLFDNLNHIIARNSVSVLDNDAPWPRRASALLHNDRRASTRSSRASANFPNLCCSATNSRPTSSMRTAPSPHDYLFLSSHGCGCAGAHCASVGE